MKRFKMYDSLLFFLGLNINNRPHVYPYFNMENLILHHKNDVSILLNTMYSILLFLFHNGILGICRIEVRVDIAYVKSSQMGYM